MEKKALHKLSYGLYVVGVKTAAGFGGCVVDAVAQLTADDQPTIVVGSIKGNNTNLCIKAEGSFTLSVLPADVDPFVVACFGFQSSRDVDKWANVPHKVVDGLPVLDGAASYIRCRLAEAKELTTHTAFFCTAIDAWLGESQAKPLIYGDYQTDMRSAALAAFQAFKAK